jgi:hypothetical protein
VENRHSSAESPACGTQVMSRTRTTAHTVTQGEKGHTLCLSTATAAVPRVLHMCHPHLDPPYIHHAAVHTPQHTQSLKVQRDSLSASARQQQQHHVCCTYVTLTCFRISTMQPQVQPDGGHDVTGSSAGASTVGRCAVGSLPQARGCAKPPQLGGAACMRHGSHESYTHHSTQSLKVQRGTLSASARQQQQRHVCCTYVTLT